MTELRDAAEFWPEYEKCGSSDTGFARKHGVPRTTVRDWRTNLEEGLVWKYGAWREADESEDAPKADPVTVEADRLRREAERNIHRVNTREAARTEIILDHLTQALSGFAPKQFSVIPPKAIDSKRRSPMSLVCLLSDWQYGETVNPAHVMGLNAYDCEIAARRVYHLERLVLTALDIMGRSHPMPTLHLPLLGDMVSGIIHDLPETNEVNVYEQYFGVVFLLAQFVMRLAPHFEEVKLYGVFGNHGRMTEKKKSTDEYINWDWLAYQALEMLLVNQPNITCNFPRGIFMVEKIEGHDCLFTHNANAKSWNQIPLYGIKRAVSQLTELLQAVDQKFEYAFFAHFHQGCVLDRAVGEIIVNPSLVGGGEFSINNILASSPPRQRIMAFHAEHGKTWELNNNLKRGDNTPHPYIIPTGCSLAEGYKKVVQ
jgi:hypothetical protein